MSHFDDLIPEMRDWNNGAGIGVESWVGCTGNFRLAVGYSTIFWPGFVEFEDYVLRAGFSVESLRSFAARPDIEPWSVEAVMNHLHLDSIQYLGCEDITRERLLYLGRTLCEIYRAKLAWQFPTRHFAVQFNESPEQPLEAYQITFHQVPSLLC
jgi:hypothetical protein